MTGYTFEILQPFQFDATSITYSFDTLSSLWDGEENQNNNPTNTVLFGVASKSTFNNQEQIYFTQACFKCFSVLC